MNALNFVETLTVEQFKDQNKVTTIEVKQNSHTGKLFFVYGAKTGTVSLKGLPTKPMISLCNGTLDRMPTAEESQFIGKSVKDEDGNIISDPRANGYFYLIHEEGQGAPTVATF